MYLQQRVGAWTRGWVRRAFRSSCIASDLDHSLGCQYVHARCMSILKPMVAFDGRHRIPIQPLRSGPVSRTVKYIDVWNSRAGITSRVSASARIMPRCEKQLADKTNDLINRRQQLDT